VNDWAWRNDGMIMKRLVETFRGVELVLHSFLIWPNDKTFS